MRIYFLVPDHEIPSWGIGMIYHLAISSIDLGLDAQILRMSESTSVPAWLNVIVQQSTLPAIKNQISNSDILIIPDILAADQTVQLLRGRKVVLIQGSVMIPIGLKSYADYQTLGYVHAIAIMPHIKKVLQNFWPINTTIISPFIAEYFFITHEREEMRDRKKQILLYPKPGYREAGYFDYEIVESVLKKSLEGGNQLNAAQKSAWSVIELKNKSHLEVAHLMQESFFFINTNCFESFNTTIPEAMAAGCITFCYEAFGGQDFLINEENAFVFPNNYVYPLLSKVLNIVNDLESYMEKLGRIQDHGLHTARQFEKSRTIRELKIFYQKFGVIS